jgi:type I restriction enzyme S subunit
VPSKTLKKKIPLPPLAEQQKIVNILQDADADIELINERINALRTQKRGLMQKLLTGEVRVAA